MIGTSKISHRISRSSSFWPEFVSLTLAALITITCGSANAEGPHDEGMDPQPKNVMAVKTLHSKKHGKVHVVFRNDGHVQAKPFMVEIRPQCKSGKKAWRDLPVVDMESACGVNMKSLKLSEERGEIQVLINDIDADDYRRRSFRAPGQITPICLKQARLFTIPLESLCK